MLIPINTKRLVHGQSYELVVVKDTGWVSNRLPIGKKDTFVWDMEADFGKGKFKYDYNNGYVGWFEAELLMLEITLQKEVLRQENNRYGKYVFCVEEYQNGLLFNRSIDGNNIGGFYLPVEDVIAAYKYCERNGLILDVKV